MIGTLMFLALRLFALSVTEWVVVVGGLAGTGVLSTWVTGLIQLRRLRLEAKGQDITVRTVAADEALSTVQGMATLVGELRTEVVGCRAREEACEQRWREHLRTCRGD